MPRVVTVSGTGPRGGGLDGFYTARGKRNGKPWYVRDAGQNGPKKVVIEWEDFQGGTWRIGVTHGKLKEEGWVKMTRFTAVVATTCLRSAAGRTARSW